MTTTPNPIFEYWDIDTPVHEAIGQAIGAASMCWDPLPTGVFQSELALKISDELLDLLKKKLWTS
jgi:hypothetical protein